MFYSIDEIEADKAVLIGDDKQRLVVNVAQLPVGAKQGDVLRYCGDTLVQYPKERDHRREKAARQMQRLVQKTDKK